MTRPLRFVTPVRAAAVAGVSALALAGVGALTGAPAADAQVRLSNGAPASFADLIEDVSPSVVSINVVSGGGFAPGSPDFSLDGVPPELRDFFEQFRRQMTPDQPQREARSLGSGFFIRADGYVVTNHHVVDDANAITVVLDDGEEYDATLVGTDRETDLAVLKVERAEPFPAVSFDTDMSVRRGDWVVAVGNPYGLQSTATAGIVSAIGREVNSQYNPFIQVDAAINRGNSGGPTFNLDGEVIGVNSQIYSPTGASVGIGFAIPADTAANIVDRLIQDGRVIRGWLGVQIQSVTEDIAEASGLSDDRGAIVSQVIADSPALEAGFQAGDIIIEVDGDEVEDNLDLTRRVGDLLVGQRVAFRVVRDGRERTIRVNIGERPGDASSVPALTNTPSSGLSDDFGLRLGRLTAEDRERLDLSSGDVAVLITGVEPGSTADDAGLQDDWAILNVNGEPVSSRQEFEAAIDDARDRNRSSALLYVRTPRQFAFIPLPLNDD